jgi:chromosome partitioning protein
LPLPPSQAKDGGVSDADNFRTRATEIFRQLRTDGERAATESDSEATEPDAEQPTTDESSPDASSGDRIAASDQSPTPDTMEPAYLNATDTLDPDTRNVGSITTEADSIADNPGHGEAHTEMPAVGEGPAGGTDEAPEAFVAASPGVVPLVFPRDEALRLDPLAGLGLETEEQVAPGNRRHPGSERPLPRILAIANQKGGVGKTTTAVNLGAALAELGYRVLVTDLDPQGNATTGLGINGRNLDASIYDVLLHETPLEDVIEPTTLRNLFVVPATIDLAGAEIELVPVFSRELRLRRALDTVRDDFDFILIDCPPSLGLLTVNGLAAATEVVVPIQCEYYALEGLGQLLRNVNLVQGNLNNGLELSTIILTMYDARTRLAEQVVNDVRKHFGARVCRSVVPRTVRLSEAPSFGQPIIVFDSSSRGAIAYRELAKEVSGGAPQRVR